MIVLGIALTIVSVFLLVVSAIVSSAVSAGNARCSPAPCGGIDPGPWFAWLGLPLLLLGLALAVGGFWWARK